MEDLDKLYRKGIWVSICGVIGVVAMIITLVNLIYGEYIWWVFFGLAALITFISFMLNRKVKEKIANLEYEESVMVEQAEIDKFCEIEEVGSKIEDIERNNKDYVLSVKEVKSVGQRNTRCPSCGSQTNGDYCEHCGRKVVDYTKSLTYKLYGCTKEYRFVNGRLVDAIVIRR